MSRCSPASRRLCRSLLLLVPVALLGPPAAAGERPRRPKATVRVPGLAGLFVDRAVQGAIERLADERCRAVLSDFSGEFSKRPLAAVLADSGSLEDHLSGLVFEDGSTASACGQGRSFAGMRRSGESVVYVCPTRFRELAQRNPVLAEVIIIHEMLHTLGLGENPPTSAEITTRVMRRCVDDPLGSTSRR